MLVSIYLEKPSDVAGLILCLRSVDFGFNVLGVALRQEIVIDFVGHLGATTLCAYDHQSAATLVTRLVGFKTAE